MSTPAPAPSAPAFNPLSAVGSFLSGPFAALANAEKIALIPPIQTFLTWVAANPGEATNPLTATPQINVLLADLGAAQVSAQTAIVTELATSLNANLTAQLNAAKAALPT